MSALTARRRCSVVRPEGAHAIAMAAIAMGAIGSDFDGVLRSGRRILVRVFSMPGNRLQSVPSLKGASHPEGRVRLGVFSVRDCPSRLSRRVSVVLALVDFEGAWTTDSRLLSRVYMLRSFVTPLAYWSGLGSIRRRYWAREITGALLRIVLLLLYEDASVLVWSSSPRAPCAWKVGRCP